MPKISVVTTVYNEEKYVEESLESILTQSYKDFELVVVDDGSTDGTFSILSDIAQRDKRIRMFSFPKNKGRAAAANYVMWHVHSELIARHDADDISLPNRFELQVNAFDSDHSIGAIGGAIRIDKEVHRHPKRVTNEIYKKMLVNHPTLMFRYEYFHLAGGYDEKLERCSDWDFCCRLFKVGCKIINLPKPLVKYRRQPAEPAYYRDVHKVMKRWAEEWENSKTS